MLKLLLCTAATVLLVAILLFLLQNRLLYFPDRYSPEELLASGRALAMEPWPGAGAREFRGLLAQAPRAISRGTVIVFHGNAGSARDRGYFRDALAPLGYRVLLAEYPGYASRPGRLSEASLVADAGETVRLVRASFAGPVLLWGESLGCAVAAAAARDLGDAVSGLALVTPWADLPSLAQAVYPFLPAQRLVRDRYDSVANLSDYRGRVAVCIAARDEIIPGAHSRRLFEAIRGPKRLWQFKNAGHNSWPIRPGEAWWREVADFLSPSP